MNSHTKITEKDTLGQIDLVEKFVQSNQRKMNVVEKFVHSNVRKMNNILLTIFGFPDTYF